LKTNRDVETWIARLVSYARTEKGLMEMPQGLAVMFVEYVELDKNGTFELEVEHRIEG